MFQILNQEHTKEGEGGFLAPRSLQSNFGIFAWMCHESQKQLKTNIGQDVIAENVCSVETGGERVTEVLWSEMSY